MPLIVCPECAKNVSDKADACPNCGYPIKLEMERIYRESVSVKIKSRNKNRIVRQCPTEDCESSIEKNGDVLRQSFSEAGYMIYCPLCGCDSLAEQWVKKNKVKHESSQQAEQALPTCTDQESGGHFKDDATREAETCEALRQADDDRLTKKTVCRHCKKEFEYTREYCPFCDKWNVKPIQDKVMKRFLILLIGTIAIVSLFIVVDSRLEQVEITRLENDKSIRIESENNGLKEAKFLLSSKKNFTAESWKIILGKLHQVSTDNPSYQEAMNLLPSVQEKLADIEKKNKKEFETYAKKGEISFKRIISKYPQLDRSYLEPFVSGSLSNNPRSDLIIPKKDWISLSDSEKKAIGYYAASLIDKVIANPSKYSGVTPGARLAQQAAKNVANISRNSWCIVLGDLSGNDISLDETGSCGTWAETNIK
jgi:RNA polymerase subunit RPABC4/transcription elongation factor Spt4